jgi:hypothetical protein
MALDAVATNVSDTFNAYAIPQWVNYNYAGVTDYPRLKVGNLETREVVNYATAVTGLLQSGGITAGPELDEALRDILNLPQKPEEPVTQKEHRVWQGIEVNRELTPCEKTVSFGEIESRLNNAELDVLNAASGVQKKQIDKLAEIVAKII